MRIALLEDDKPQADLMRVWLEAVGHQCRHFADGASFMGRHGVAGGNFDLVILDWLLPDTSGDKVLRWLRDTMDWPVPVIFVTQKDSETDLIYALEHGADDYMTKPVKPLEMLARITALGRRAGAGQGTESNLEFGSYRFDLQSRTVSHEGKPVELTQKEFDLALYIFRNAGRLLTRAQLLETVWRRSSEVNTRTVDTHISRIRTKLSLTEAGGWRLSAVYQQGYRLERFEPDGKSHALGSRNAS